MTPSAPSSASPDRPAGDAAALASPARLAALRRVGLLGATPSSTLPATPPELERIVRLAHRSAGAPAVWISLLTDRRQLVAAGMGVPAAWIAADGIGLERSFCRFVVTGRRPVVVDDARHDELVRAHPALAADGLVAYAGVPIVLGEGEIAGAVAAAWPRPHAWTLDELAALDDAATLVARALEARAVGLRHEAEQQELLAVQEFASEALRDVESRYRVLFESNPRPMWVFDAESLEVLAVNEAALEQYGYARREFLAMRIADLWPERDRGPNVAEVRRAVESRRTVTSPARHRRRDGTQFDVEVTGHPIRFQGREARLVVVDDVTERRRAEAALRAEQAFTAAVLDTAAALVVVLDPEGRVVRLNRAMETLIGCTQGEAAGRSCWELFLVPEEEPVVRRAFDRIRAGDFPSTYEYHCRTAAGERRLIRWSNTALLDPAGGLAFVVCTGIDVTAQRAMEAVLRASEDRFRALVESAPVGVSVVRDGRLLWVNDAFRRIFAYDSTEEMRGLSPLDCVAPAARGEIAERMRARAAGGLAPSSYETLGLRRGGEVFPVHVAVTVATLVDGPALVAFTADVTERVRAEEERRRIEQRAELVARATNDAIYEWDVDTGAVSWSEGLQTLFGYAPDQLRRDAGWWASRIHPEDRAAVLQGRGAALAAPSSGGRGGWSGEYRFLRADGTYATILDRGFVVRDEDGRARRLVGGLADVSQHRALEEQLRQAQKMEAVGRLAGGIAHDFNNLLTGIISYSELILGDLPPADPIRDDVEQIRLAGERAANLTRQLLAFSRRQMLRPKPLDVNAVVADLDKMLRRLIGEHIELVLALAPSVGTVLADPGQLEQVLVNLAVNARDAMPEGGTLTIQTEDVDLDAAAAERLKHVEPGPYVLLTVRDTGVGMDPAVRAHIFEPFFTTKPAGQGTGLGLSTVYGIVKQSGGSIFVASVPGHGTTFAIYLPRVAREAAPRRNRVSLPAVRGASETILLVEDDRLVRTLTREILVRHGYQVLEAANGADALRICEESSAPIDLVITDVVMPKMGGRQLVERLPEARRGVPVLYVSGYTGDAVLSPGLGPGTLADGVELLPKPFTPETLTRRVRAMLERQARQERRD